MRRGTTPTISLAVQGCDLTGCTIYATLKQGTTIITKTGNDLTVLPATDHTGVTFDLTQTDTLKLKPGKAAVQIRWIDSNGIALATDISEIDVTPILLEGEISYA